MQGITVIFNLSLMLLLTESHLISEKQGSKKDILVACDFGYIKIVFVKATKIILFYI